MFIQELKQLMDSYNGPYDSQAQEDSVIENTLSNIEDKLAYEARYKSYHVDKHERTVYWVTQETSPRESQIAADAIAHELAMQHIKDYKVKVVLRDLYRGDDDKTPWQVAYTDHFMPEVDDEGDDDEAAGGAGHQDKASSKPGFKPLHDESDFEKYDPEDRHTRRIRRYNHEIGGIEYVQPQGHDMPITAVWYTHAGIGSAPTTSKITDLNDYLMMDPYNPAKGGHVHENLEEAVGKRTGFVGPFKSEDAGITDANGKVVCTVNSSDKVGPARMNERKKVAAIIAKALSDQL